MDPKVCGKLLTHHRRAYGVDVEALCDRIPVTAWIFALFFFLDFLFCFAFPWLCGSETWEDHVFLGFIVACHPHRHPKIMSFSSLTQFQYSFLGNIHFLLKE